MNTVSVRNGNNAITSIDSVGVPVTTRPLIDPVGGHSGALAQPRVHPPE